MNTRRPHAPAADNGAADNSAADNGAAHNGAADNSAAHNSAADNSAAYNGAARNGATHDAAPRAGTQRTSESGFILLCVLVLVTVIGTLTAAYARHVLTSTRQSSGSLTAQSARQTTRSALSIAQQSLISGTPVASSLPAIRENEPDAQVHVTDLGPGVKCVKVVAVDASGLGATVQAETNLVPARIAPDSDGLPCVEAGIASSVKFDPAIPKLSYAGVRRLENLTLDGLVVVETGATLTLSDVVVNGSIVSEAVLSPTPIGSFDAATAPTLVIEGGLTINPSTAVLDGVGIVMPDGVLSTVSGARRLVFKGDIVAHTVTLDGVGILRGNVAAVDPAVIQDGLEYAGGYGRGAMPWAPSLAITTWAHRFTAFPPRAGSASEAAAITNFSFP